MAANLTLNPVKVQGWRTGLANMLKREADGWKSRRGLTQILVWMLIINGLLLAILNSPDSPEKSGGVSPAVQAFTLFCITIGYICPIGIMVASMGAIVGEKQNGTAAWILSKPISRTAFILSKFLAASLGYLLSVILLPGLVAYFLMISHGLPMQINAMLEGLGLLFLNLLFFQSFTIMMGTLTNSRRIVIGSSLGLIFVLNQLTQMSFGMYLPGHLPLDAAVVLANQPYPNLVSLLETAGLMVLFMALAFWRFSREEF